VNNNHIVLFVYAFCFAVTTVGVWYLSPNIENIKIKDLVGVLASSIIAVVIVSKVKWLHGITEPKFTTGMKFAVLTTLVLVVVNQLPPFKVLGGSLDSYLVRAAVFGFVGFLVSLVVMPVCGISGLVMKKYLTSGSTG